MLIILARLQYMYEVRPDVSMLLATTVIFAAATESKIKDKIEVPSTYLMASVIIKIIKAVTTIAMLAMNNETNDFFVAYFFCSSALNGIVYLNICGYEVPKNTGFNERNPI